MKTFRVTYGLSNINYDAFLYVRVRTHSCEKKWRGSQKRLGEPPNFYVSLNPNEGEREGKLAGSVLDPVESKEVR